MKNKTALESLLEATRNPLEDIIRHHALMDQALGVNSAVTRVLEQSKWLDRLSGFPQHIETLNRHSAVFKAVQSVLARPALLEQIEALTKPAAGMQRLVDAALLPDRTGIAHIAKELASQFALFETATLPATNWSRLLETQMAAVRTPWVDLHLPSLSFEGFAVVSRLGRAVRYADPFDEASREQIDEDLGAAIIVAEDAGPEERDAAHVEAGMNASMLAISPAAVGDVLIQTGFVFKAKYAPLPATTDGTDPGHVFHPGHNFIITTLEQNLRMTIDAGMRAQYGDDWIDARIAAALVMEWKDRRDLAVAHGESPLPLIQYSNFMEMKDIVVGRQHWREVFEKIFKKKEHFQVSMERLHPIRLPLAHSRPIGIAQQYHLISEASLLLRMLGVDIFQG